MHLTLLYLTAQTLQLFPLVVNVHLYCVSSHLKTTCNFDYEISFVVCFNICTFAKFSYLFVFFCILGVGTVIMIKTIP